MKYEILISNRFELVFGACELGQKLRKNSVLLLL